MKNSENPAFLKEQLISYLGNKRSIINEILKVIYEIKNELKRDKISFVDVFMFQIFSSWSVSFVLSSIFFSLLYGF